MKPDIQKYAKDPLAFFDALTIPSAHGPKRFAECMAGFQRERFSQIAPALLALAKGEKPKIGRYWWEATKGASKDSDLACCLLWLLAFTKRPQTCQVGAADMDQADELRKAAKDILQLNPWLESRIEIQSWKVLCRATNSEAAIISADTAGSHGARPSLLILNELVHVSKQEFAENLADNASKVPNGLMVVATNSGFTGTWQESWRRIAETSDRWCMNCYSRPSPWLDEAHVAEAERRNSRARFQRLYWGVWASQSGDALDQADLDASIDSSLTPMGREAGWSFVAGLDLGIKHDHSALVVVAFRRDSQDLRLAYAESWAPHPKTRQVDLIRIEETILSMHQRFDFVTVAYDPYAAQLMAQRLSRQRVPMQEVPFVGKNLNQMASTLLEVFRSRRLRMYPCHKLIADLGRLTIVEKSYGYKLEAVHDQHGHADLATALALCLPAAVARCGRPRIVLGAGWDLPRDDYDSTPAWVRNLNALAEKAARDAEQDRKDLRRADDLAEEMAFLQAFRESVERSNSFY